MRCDRRTSPPSPGLGGRALAHSRRMLLVPVQRAASPLAQTALEQKVQLNRTSQPQAGEQIGAQYVTWPMRSEIDTRRSHENDQCGEHYKDDIAQERATPDDEDDIKGEPEERGVLDHMSRRETVAAERRRHMYQLR